jgi:hypothetical protein
VLAHLAGRYVRALVRHPSLRALWRVEAAHEGARAYEAACRGPSGAYDRHRARRRGSAARIPRRNMTASFAVPCAARAGEALGRGSAGFCVPNRGRCTSPPARKAGRRRARRSLVAEPEAFEAAPEADAPTEEVASNRAHDHGRRVCVHDEPPFEALRLIAKTKPTARTTARAPRTPRIVPSIEPPYPHHPLVRFGQS